MLELMTISRERAWETVKSVGRIPDMWAGSQDRSFGGYAKNNKKDACCSLDDCRCNAVL
jgi:hypothetical protein